MNPAASFCLFVLARVQQKVSFVCSSLFVWIILAQEASSTHTKIVSWILFQVQ